MIDSLSLYNTAANPSSFRAMMPPAHSTRVPALAWGGHILFVPAALSPRMLICNKGWSRGRSASLPALCSSAVLLEDSERKQIFHFIASSSAPRWARGGRAVPALPSSPPQLRRQPEPANGCPSRLLQPCRDRDAPEKPYGMGMGTGRGW